MASRSASISRTRASKRFSTANSLLICWPFCCSRFCLARSNSARNSSVVTLRFPAWTTSFWARVLKTSLTPKTAKLRIRRPIRTAATQDFAKARMWASMKSFQARKPGAFQRRV